MPESKNTRDYDIQLTLIQILRNLHFGNIDNAYNLAADLLYDLAQNQKEDDQYFNQRMDAANNFTKVDSTD